MQPISPCRIAGGCSRSWSRHSSYSGVDAFVVNVAIPTIAAELHASSAEIESVIAIYLIGYATLIVTGGRLGDIYGTKGVFLAGVLGFTLTSLWCGLAQSGPELIAARLTASRISGVRAKRRGTMVLIEGCAIQIASLAVLALTVGFTPVPTALALTLILMIFGHGQGLVMAPLSGVVLSTVKPASAGSGSGMYGTTAQIANAAGVAAIGAVFFAIQMSGSASLALFIAIVLLVLSIVTCAAMLSWMRRATA